MRQACDDAPQGRFILAFGPDLGERGSCRASSFPPDYGLARQEPRTRDRIKMKIASVADVKAKFSAYLKSSEGGPVVITRNGRPVAVLLGVENEEEIERLLMAYSPRLRAILDRSRVQIGKGENVAHEQLWTGDERPATSPSSRRIKRNKTT